jgi:copper chaperone
MLRQKNRQTADPTDAIPASSVDTDGGGVCQTVRVAGMTCRHCELAVSAELQRIPTVTGVIVDVAAGRVTLEASRPVDPAAIASAIEDAGYEVVR